MPRLVRDQRVAGTDRLMRFLYDAFAPLHDPAVHYLLPILERGGSEAAIRDAYMRRVQLDSLGREISGRAARILEVGIGTGANLGWIRRDLPAGVEADVWGMDVSTGMTRIARGRARAAGLGFVRLLIADAHALPFPDGFFDRVFHVGGINAFRSPRIAIAEMARVARPGTPIVIVDEQLDPRVRCPIQRAAFRLITFYDSRPHCPREHLPPEADRVIEEQISPFYYCLTFRMPAGAKEGPAAQSNRGRRTRRPSSRT